MDYDPFSNIIKKFKKKEKVVGTSIRGYINWVIMLPVINLDLSNMP